jgi:hypothetical protein
MKRFTDKAADGKGYVAAPGGVEACDGGWRGAAVDRLAAFENLYETLERRITDIPGELTQLRAQGREKSVRFRELTGERMMAMSWMDRMKELEASQAN